MWLKTAAALAMAKAQIYVCPADEMRYSIGYEIPSTFTTADYNPNASLTLTFTKSDGTFHQVK